MNGGLREIWQLPEVSRTPAGTQAEEFARAFRDGLAALNQSAHQAAALAPPAEFKPLDAQRAQLYEAYQKVSARIDPADPARAEPDIKRVLTAVGALRDKLAALTARVSSGRADWQAREADFDAAVQKIGELEEAAHPKSPTLRRLSDSIRGKANAGEFGQGVAAFDQLNSRLADFSTQHVAQAGAEDHDAPSGGSAKSTWEANVQSIQADLDRVMHETPADPATAQLREKVINVNTMMRAAADDGDYTLAGQYADELLQLLKDYEQAQRATAQRSAQKSYEAQAGALKRAIDEVDKSQPADQAAAELRGKILALRTQMELFAGLQDFVAAKQEADRIQPLLAKYKEANAQAAAQKKYQERIDRIKPELHKEMEVFPEDSVSAGVHKQLVDTGYEMEMAAARKDFVTASDRLAKIPALIESYRRARESHRVEVAQQAQAKPQFEQKFARVQQELRRVVADTPIDPTTKKLHQEVASLDDQIAFALHQANYSAANGFVDEVAPLLDRYRAARAKVENDPRYQYEQARKPIEASLKRALEPARKEKFMAGLQAKVRAAKAAMDSAAAKKDFAAARKQALSLAEQLVTFHNEDRKTPRDLIWVLATSGAMHKKIQQLYNQAADKLDEIAKAYDDALAEHQQALKDVKERDSLLESVLVGLFFAGLGGAVGGAVGNWLKGSLSSAAANSGAGGALIDAAKDVYKFAARLKPQLDAKSEAKEVSGLAVLSGSGAELTRQLARRLRAEQNKLLDVLIDLDHQVKNAAGKATTIRVEGDPEESLDRDVFLKTLNAAPAADKKGFAKAIWTGWLNEYGYKVTSYGETIYYSEQKIYYEVKSNFDTDLIPHIQRQAGSDLNIYFELKKSEAKAFEKMKKMASAKPADPRTGKNLKFE